MSLRLCPSLVAALVLSVTIPSTSFADSSGTAGYVAAVTINGSSSSDYGAAHGSVSVREGADGTATLREYKWGGSLCTNIDKPDASDIALLFEALKARADVQIVPSYKSGNGGTRCLTSFKLRAI